MFCQLQLATLTQEPTKRYQGQIWNQA